jgi:hypothetical protein
MILGYGRRQKTGCGSALIYCGSGSRSGSRVLMTKNLKELQLEKLLYIFVIKNCNLLIPRPPYRTPKLQEKPSALKKEHPAL